MDNNLTSPEEQETIDRVMNMKFGHRNGGKTISELFDYTYGKSLPPDPSPYQVRARLIFLGGRYEEMMYEKTMSQRLHGTKQVGIFNNVLQMLDREIKVTQDINMSLMSEARILGLKQ